MLRDRSWKVNLIFYHEILPASVISPSVVSDEPEAVEIIVALTAAPNNE